MLNSFMIMSCYRRHTPYGNQTDYRIFELNKTTELDRGKNICIKIAFINIHGTQI